MQDIPFIVVLGLGKSGQAVASYCHNHGIPFVIVDDKPEAAKLWTKDRGYLCEKQEVNTLARIAIFRFIC